MYNKKCKFIYNLCEKHKRIGNTNNGVNFDITTAVEAVLFSIKKKKKDKSLADITF